MGTLISLSWKEIHDLLQQNSYPFQVGDYKDDINLNGQVVRYRIIGFNQDVPVSKKNKNISTWEAVEMLPRQSLNIKDVNYNGWQDTDIRQYLNTSFLDNCSIDLQKNIQQVYKKNYLSEYQNQCLNTTQDRVWIKSEYEVYGRNFWSVDAKDGEWYEYYRQEGIRYNGWINNEPHWQWLRSCRKNHEKAFCIVTEDGSPHSCCSDKIGSFVPCFVI